MAPQSSTSSAGIVAIFFAIMIAALVGSFIAWQVGALGDGDHRERDALQVGAGRK